MSERSRSKRPAGRKSAAARPRARRSAEPEADAQTEAPERAKTRSRRAAATKRADAEAPAPRARRTRAARTAAEARTNGAESEPAAEAPRRRRATRATRRTKASAAEAETQSPAPLEARADDAGHLGEDGRKDADDAFERDEEAADELGAAASHDADDQGDDVRDGSAGPDDEDDEDDGEDGDAHDEDEDEDEGEDADEEDDEGEEEDEDVEIDAATLDAALRAASARVDPELASAEHEEELLAAVPLPRRRRTVAAPLGELPPVPAPLSVDEAARRLGIEELYPEQRQVVASVAAGRDVLLVLPTGFGKSACYQVPSMVLPRPVVVVSPLLALLEDQHSKLLARGVRVARLDGTVRGRARKQALADVARGGPILVMTTPETLGNPELRSALAGPGVGLLAVDEAHCISEWGYDFRPAYRRLGARVRELGAPPVLALTATATERVREAIIESLGMREPEIIAASPHRSNLAFEVLPCERDLRLRALLRLARRLHRPGIIYCATRREVELIYLLLRRFGIPAHRYHGGMTAKERESEQEKFMDSGRRVVMVATSAFGLGIDKPDIRYVLHYQAPASLEQYVQEAGRSGRDGKKANCILLWDPSDRSIHEALLSRSRVRPDQLYRLAAALAAWADEEREPTLEALALSAEMGTRVAGALLTKLEEAGLIEFEDQRIRVVGNQGTFEQDARALAGQFETLRTEDAHRLDALAEYANDTGCRAQFLRQYFGEPAGERCGLCDVCRGRPQRPEAFFAPIAKPTPPGRRRRGGRGRAEPRGRGRRRGRGRPGRAHPERVPREAPLEAGGGAQLAVHPRPGRRRRGRRGGRRRRAGAGPNALIAPEILAQPFVLDEAELTAPADRESSRPEPPMEGAHARSEGARAEHGPGPGGGHRRRRGRRGGRRRRGRGRRGAEQPGLDSARMPPPPGED